MKGFINHNNFCYFNVSLKCILTACPEMKDETYTGDCEFTNYFYRLVRAYYDPDVTYINPRPLFEIFRKRFTYFTPDEQHDIQECILCIIDILEIELPYFKKKFYGLKENQIIYPGGKNVFDENFCMYILESKPHKTMDELFNESFKWNTIENYVSDEGKQYNLATTRSIIKKLPEILMITFDSKSNIEVSETLNVKGYEYELIFSGIHRGVQYGGHYFCVIKFEGNWILNDDMNIFQLNEFPTKDGHYVLTYILKTRQS